MWRTLPRNLITACKTGFTEFNRNIQKGTAQQAVFGYNDSTVRHTGRKTDEGIFESTEPVFNVDNNLESEFYTAFLTDVIVETCVPSELHDVGNQSREMDVPAVVT